MILGVPVKETSGSQVSCRAAKPPGWPAGSPAGSHLALDLPGNVTQRQTQAATPHAARYRILFHSIMNSSHFVFPFLPWLPPAAHSASQPLWSRACCLRDSALMTKVRVCLLMHKHSSCPATHPHAANNCALMEMFNIACWRPVGAVDGPVVC